MTYDDVLDAVEKRFHVNTSAISKEFHGISSGLLMTDLILGGGIRAGAWVTFFGAEQSAKCLVGSSLVQTDRGLLRLEEIFLDSEIKTFSGFNDCPDYQVTTHTSKPGVANKVYIDQGKSTYKIRTRLGDELEGLSSHKVWVVKDNEFQFLPLTQLEGKSGDEIFIPKKVGQNLFPIDFPSIRSGEFVQSSDATNQQQQYPDVMSVNLAEFLGYWMSEPLYKFRLSRLDLRTIARFNQSSFSLFGTDCCYEHSTHGEFTLHASITRFIVSLLTKGQASTRSTPRFIRQSPKEAQVAYLRALIETDMLLTADTLAFPSSSKTLALEVKAMLENLGVLCLLYCSESSKRKHKLIIHSDYLEVFKREIGFLLKENQDKLQSLIGRVKGISWNNMPGKQLALDVIDAVQTAADTNTGLVLDGLRVFPDDIFPKNLVADLRADSGSRFTTLQYDKILEILIKIPNINVILSDEVKQKVGKLDEFRKYHWTFLAECEAKKSKPLVYDLNVEGDHSYLVNGIMTHNSTHAMKILSAAISSNVPILGYFDYEGSYSLDYMENMLDKNINSTDLFGVRDSKGKWTVLPRVRYYSESVGDVFFNMLASLMRQLPDRVVMDNKLYLVYPNTKQGKIDAGPDYVKNLFSKFNAFYVPAPEGLPDIQALFIVDSYPAMLPEEQDEDAGNNSMALQARMFSDNIKKVAGKLRKKAVTIIGINQLRLRPAVQWGCYHGSVKVSMADGSEHIIKDVVENKMVGPVLAYDPSTNQFVPKEITGWFNNGPATSWLRVVYETPKGRQGSRRRSIAVTPDHLVWSNDYNSLIAAHRLKIGDSFISVGRQLSTHARQLYLGMMLGDGWFSTNGDYIKCSYGHKGEHKWYVDWKQKILPFGNISGKEFLTHELGWCYDPVLAQIAVNRKLGCTGKQKRISADFLAELDTLALAVWYMDDGNKGGSIISMQSYPKKDVELLCDHLNKKYRTTCTIKTWSDRGKVCYGVRLSAKLLEIIAPYVHKNFGPVVKSCVRNNCLASGIKFESTVQKNIPKFIKRFGEFTAWKPADTQVGVPVTIVEIENIRQPKYNRQSDIKGVAYHTSDSGRYEITVKDLGLFVADGIVAKNSPEYEPGGEALKFTSSVRIKQVPRAIPHGKGQIEEEDSVTTEGSMDKYRYIHMRAIKNKLSTPFLEGWYRLWITDAEGKGRGFDLVWDTFEYLRATGQCEGNMKKMTITLGDLTLEKLDWYSFKGLILLTGADLKDWCASLGITTNPKIRQRCFEQLVSGEGMELFFQNVKSGKTAVKADE